MGSLLVSGAPLHLDGTGDACQSQGMNPHLFPHQEGWPVVHRELSVINDPVYVRFRERGYLDQDPLLLHINRNDLLKNNK